LLKRGGRLCGATGKKTPHSPYLANLTERDITTPSGRVLILVDPASIIKEILELSHKHPEAEGKNLYYPVSFCIMAARHAGF